MLLAIDVGNSNIVIGLYPSANPASAESGGPRYLPEQAAQWRVTTPGASTTDEFGVILRNLVASHGITVADITGIAISSVVPPMIQPCARFCERYFKVRPLLRRARCKNRRSRPHRQSVRSRRRPHRQLRCRLRPLQGSMHRRRYGHGDHVRRRLARGEFLGGAIAPGLGISAEALFARAARLPRVDVRKPAKVIGTGTVDNIQIGLYYGYIGLVDGILERMLKFHGRGGRRRGKQRCGATCPPSILSPPAVWRSSSRRFKFIEVVDDSLTLTACASFTSATSTGSRNSAAEACRRTLLNYFNYFTEIEERFSKRRGSLLMLSTSIGP